MNAAHNVLANFYVACFLVYLTTFSWLVGILLVSHEGFRSMETILYYSFWTSLSMWIIKCSR